MKCLEYICLYVDVNNKYTWHYTLHDVLGSISQRSLCLCIIIIIIELLNAQNQCSFFGDKLNKKNRTT